MRVAEVPAVPVRAGFFFDDQLAIRAGAGHDGFDYTGERRIPGFRRERQPGEAVSVLLARADGLEAFCSGTCNETDRSAQVTAHVAIACWAGQVLAKPGTGVDEGLMIVGNEMATELDPAVHELDAVRLP